MENHGIDDSTLGLLDAWLDEPEDELGRFLQCVRVNLLKHPVAALAAYRALSEEGRRFAQTPAGTEWRRRLAGSELIRRGRDVWEIATHNMLEEDTPRLLPSQYVDALCYAASLADLELQLARASEPREGQGAFEL